VYTSTTHPLGTQHSQGPGREIFRQAWQTCPYY